MTFLRVLLAMLSLAPVRGEKDALFRIALAQAIVEATGDVQEQDVLARLAWFESGYRRNVARCEILGDHGRSRGTFQVQGITDADRKASCGGLLEQAKLAVSYMHRSAAACPRNEGAMRLAVYVSGRCDRGLAQARARWGAP